MSRGGLILLTLAALGVAASGCPGNAPLRTRGSRPDGGPQLFADSQVNGPTPAREARPALEAGSIPKVTTTPQADGAPTATSCTAVNGACGSGQPGCCAGSHCVKFQTTFCAKICTGNKDCTTNCCVSTSQNVSVCAEASYCPAATPAPTNPPPPANPPPTATASCKGYCGGKAPAGCYCDYFCAMYGDCCPDVLNCIYF